ncbi:M15 family metallopeptidase [Microbacterium dauci]|uniref:M15 family metallopeptidase n=1 Tax=Microbacterium dauci TaxID=3048008 RepID=A0ABT6ZCN3_9MICO|nr:M15 family metallopeptidase [Microbacterium sp. LX3-4]MDJ1113920.1 M15 family metallopeptidase [Microbacterium sp. LX3-4]
MPKTPPSRRAILRARRRRRALVILVLTSAMIATIVIFVPRALSGPAASERSEERSASSASATPEAAGGSPTPAASEPAAPAACDTPEVIAALESGSDADIVAAFGGGEPFRAAVAADAAPCIDLHDASRLWVVVNKRTPLDPLEYWPVPQARPQSTRIIAGGWLLDQTASALDELSAAVSDAGAGTIAVSSGFRPYDFQVDTYARHVANRGQEGADLRSARPGHSEHQTGLAVDVVACDGSGCGDHDGFGGTPQSDWIAANAWRYGFIVRYEDGHTDTTGYSPEPWHLRFVGHDLAAAYAEGGYTTLEEFFGLPAAPDYG